MFHPLPEGPFFQGGLHCPQNTAMTINGLTVTLNMPHAPKSRFDGLGEEIAQRLPPYNRRAAFLVDDYPGAPAEWMRSQPGTASYMVPVLPEHGCWLDFNDNQFHTHDVAVMVSIQGVNALTGQKADKLVLEQYSTHCPVHHERFVGNRRCSKCGFEWPNQNYLATTAQPHGLFWLDGFRAADGVVRQWVFTLEQARSVAKAILGEERVHALGVAFFLSKEPKPVRPTVYGRAGYNSAAHHETLYACCVGEDMLAMDMPRARSFRESAPRIEVAAGARIDQKVYPDPKDLSYWQETPAGIIVINYTDEQTMLDVLQSGRQAGEGFLGGIGVELGQK